MVMSVRTKTLVLLVGALACLGVAGFLLSGFRGSWGDPEPTVVAGPALSGVDTSFARPSKPAAENPEMFAYITGAVLRPGVYPIGDNARVFNLVQSAGGLTAQADSGGLNMAAPVKDGAHVHVPLREREGNAKKSSKASPQSQSRRGTGSSSKQKGVASFVYVNEATVEELTALPGVGPVLARRIVEMRQQQGPFVVPEDLLKVSGIGEKKLKQIRPLLRF